MIEYRKNSDGYIWSFIIYEKKKSCLYIDEMWIHRHWRKPRIIFSWMKHLIKKIDGITHFYWVRRKHMVNGKPRMSCYKVDRLGNKLRRV